MIDLISLDPGTSQHALAFFENYILQAVRFIVLKDLTAVESKWLDAQWALIDSGIPRPLTVSTAPRVIYEMPKHYPTKARTKKPADPNDLILLAATAAQFARVMTRWECIKYVYPSAWKGQLSKEKCHHRIWQILTPAERACFPPDTEQKIETAINGGPYSSKVHNLLDAAGIGLYELDRFSP